MDANEKDQNKNLMIALVLTGLVLVGWQYLFPQPLPESSVQQKTTEASTSTDKIQNDNINVVTGKDIDLSKEATNEVNSTEFILENESARVVISNFLELKSFSYKNTSRNLNEVFPEFGAKISILEDGKRFEQGFNLNQISPTEIEFSQSKTSGLLRLNSDGQLLIKAKSDQGLQFVGSIVSKEESKDQKVNNFVYYTDELVTEAVGEDLFEEKDIKLGWFGIDYDYHVLAFVVPGNSFHLRGEKSELKLANLRALNELEFKVSFLKKNYDDLANLGDNLKNAVDFGIWSVIALPMLRGLQLFYSYLQNWGLAIIFLTILIRLAMFPLQHSSFKSMKKMQVLQPELKKIKEKYKDDQRKQQEQTMALFKKHGANPVGGCLPLFLQMPIFFAFYRMLYNSVELVDAPFYLWIQDLSERDPFYILPALVGGAMYFSMKLNPQTSMDPAQQKIMKFMPLMFSAFLFTLPAGLNLYIFVSTIVGMAQQIFVYKRTPSSVSA
ncbi:MAG: hypothetical protein CME65_12280 [Halobacteriovoraceae bacterium]|nr:hypothetical protein [Halobacteriovoraceae bacterium]|tara:strand:- start:10701 stop:12191 length:1491 start_codon:yes stop_codon:yes gene_type:complete